MTIRDTGTEIDTVRPLSDTDARAAGTATQQPGVRPLRQSLVVEALALGVAASTLLLPAPASATSAAEDFTRIPAVIQRYLQTAGDIVIIGGKRVHAAGYALWVNDQQSVLALSLDPRRPSASSTFRMVPAQTRSIGAVASALWLHDNAPTVGRPLEDPALETAAIQAAIWVEEGTLRLTPERIPNRVLRQRVTQLVRAAPSSVEQVPNYPTGLQFTSSVREVDSEWVTLQLVAIQSGETTFNESQDIDLRVDGS